LIRQWLPAVHTAAPCGTYNTWWWSGHLFLYLENHRSFLVYTTTVEIMSTEPPAMAAGRKLNPVVCYCRVRWKQGCSVIGLETCQVQELGGGTCKFNCRWSEIYAANSFWIYSL